MPERFIVAIDLGTSAARAVLFDLSAKPIRVVRQPYLLLSPQPGWSEQDPEEIIKAVVHCLREIVKQVSQLDEILCVTFSSQMYSILALNQEGKAVTNSFTWNDRRSAAMVEELKGDENFRKLIVSTGCPVSEIFPIYKILWLKQNLTGFSNLKFVSIKDYVIARLTGRLISDWSIASASGLFNIHTNQWDEDVLFYVGLDHLSNLPEVASPRKVIDQWESKIAGIGILNGTPIVLGGGDGPLASLGIGAARPGSTAINVGTSAAYRVTIETPTLDPQGRLWTFVTDENLWVTGGITTGGIVYDWLIHTYFHNKQTLPPKQIYQYVDKLIQTVAPGADGLTFVPYLSGQQSPDWNAKQCGGFVGLGAEHGVPQMARAVLEGLAFSLYRIANTVDLNIHTNAGPIYMSGGITNSDVWLQLAADVFGRDILTLQNTEGSAKGSMILGLLAFGIISKPEDLSTPETDFRRFSANEKNHEAYQTAFCRFEDALKRLIN